MKFSTKEDIEAPIDYVFGVLTDFETFERQALRRGAEISRQDPKTGVGLGSAWTIRAPFRGKPRRIEAHVSEFDPPNGLKIDSATGGVDGVVMADLMALSPKRTRLLLKLDLTPSSLTGRLLVQSLKFARSTLEKRLWKRVHGFARMVEDRYSES